MSSLLANIPARARRPTLALAFDIIGYAKNFGPERWGLTYYDEWAIRVNVGWTEIFTASRDDLRLIVDSNLATATGLALESGGNPRGYYPSIPGSALVRLRYTPSTSLSRAIRTLTPALHRAIELSARRRVGRGVRAGHNHWAVKQIAAELGRPIPASGYSSTRGGQASEPEDALIRMEGALKRVMGSRYERNPALRRACVHHYGTSCAVCGFSFREAFGPIGVGFVHVHHLVPISKTGVKKVHPINDLRPVCPNCHAMIHREDPPLAIEELRSMIRAQSMNPNGT